MSGTIRTARARLCGGGALALALVASACDRDPTQPPLPGAPALQATTQPGAPVIFLHYDYMVASDPPNPHSHAPDPEAIAMVVEAFRRQGIQLFVEPRHTEIPEVPLINFDSTTPGGPGCVTFRELRARYFSPLGNQPWHYAVFGHHSSPSGCSLEELPSGVAELPGYNLVVTLGLTMERGLCPGAFTPERCRRLEAGTLMHELGHNLDLRHGGGDNFNFKPNYVSVMNYQFQNLGIPSGRWPGDTAFATATFRVDYSGFALPTLDENHLDERVGLGGPADDSDMSLLDVSLAQSGYLALAPVTGPIDFDRNGSLDPDVRVELNTTGDAVRCGFCLNFVRYDVMTGFDDWSHVREHLRLPDYIRGTQRTIAVTP